MIQFDSIRNKSWNGRGIKVGDKSLTILKSAKLSHKLRLSPGQYNLKIIGKKRSGNGVISFGIEGDDSSSYLSKKVTFSTSTWSEYSFPFRVLGGGSSNLTVTRSGTAFGSVEIGRLIVEKLKTSEVPVKKGLYKVPKYIKQGTKVIYPDRLVKAAKKKIAFVIPYGIYGGGEIYLQEIINKLADKPLDISIIYMKSNPLKFKIDIPVTHRDVKIKDHLLGMLKSEKYNYIVYYNSKSVYDTLCSLKDQKEINSKLIEIYHSDFEWSDSLSKVPERRHLEHIIPVARSLAVDMPGVGPDRRTVLPVGIDLKRFNVRNKSNIREALGVKANGRVIGTVARLSKEKNLDYILELARAMPNDTFLIVGDGPQMRHLKKSKTPNVRLLGFQSEVEKYYNIFDAFVLPSNMEGTPISILEAMASGVQVYASKVGAIPDIIQHGYNGWFLSMNAAEDAALISKTYASEETIENGRDHVEVYHDIKNTTAAFYNIILNSDSFFIERIDDGDLKMPGEYL
jgi:glycosyltransferase involved in cell wall biosynthesis